MTLCAHPVASSLRLLISMLLSVARQATPAPNGEVPRSGRLMFAESMPQSDEAEAAQPARHPVRAYAVGFDGISGRCVAEAVGNPFLEFLQAGDLLDFETPRRHGADLGPLSCNPLFEWYVGFFPQEPPKIGIADTLDQDVSMAVEIRANLVASVFREQEMLCGCDALQPRSRVNGRLRLHAAWRSGPLTRWRGDTLRHGSKRGSLALTAMQTSAFRPQKDADFHARQQDVPVAAIGHEAAMLH